MRCAWRAAIVVAATTMPVAQRLLRRLGQTQQMQLIGDLLCVHLVHGPNVVHEVRCAEPTVGLHEEVRGIDEGFAARRFADDQADQEGE